jgi:hypothetical protein
MTNPTIRIHNTETDEIIDREMTTEEFAEHQADKAEREAKRAEAEAKAEARQKILDRLGLTADEAALLLA